MNHRERAEAAEESLKAAGQSLLAEDPIKASLALEIAQVHATLAVYEILLERIPPASPW